MHDNWLRMLQDDEPPKSSWKPRTSTQSWDQLSVHKFTKSHTVTEKGPSRGKMVLPSLVAWRACSQIRDAPAEKRRQSKVRRSSTRTEMLFLWCFSAPYWERILAASGAHCTILCHIMLFWTYGIDHSYEARVKCKIGYDGGPITWISAKPTDWTPEVNYHTSWKKWQKIRYSAENFVFLVVQGFIDSFFMLYFTYVSYIVIEGPWNFIMCPATIRSENMSEQAWGDLLQAQSQDDE